ncbi:Gr24 [Eciton burchellii]|nr:Gr24 [Eciton burchellii]
MRNVQAAMFPLLTVLCLCGFGIFEYPRGRPRLYPSILYILITWLLYVYIIIEMRLLLKRFDIEIFLIIKTSIIFVIVTTFFSFHYDKKFKNCLNKLSVVNDTLEKLGITNNYAELRVQSTCLIIGWIASICLLNIFDGLWYFECIRSFALVICLPFLINQSLHITIFCDIFQLMLLRYIGSRFEQINQHIDKLTQQDTRQTKNTWATSSSPLVRRHIGTPKRIISILMQVHLELRLITRELTKIFGVHMVMQAMAFVVFTAQLVNDIYTDMIHSSSIYEKTLGLFISYIWIITNTMKMIIFNCICEEVRNKAKKTEMFLVKLTHHTLDIETQQYIMQFLYQLLQRPLKILGLGLCFGYKYLLQCVNYIGTIIIITIQQRSITDSYSARRDLLNKWTVKCYKNRHL